MYKIVAAVNSMIENSNLIDHVTKSEFDTLFFLYDNKFCWSISTDETGHYLLRYHPGQQRPEELASYSAEMWRFENFISYSTRELKTKEAMESFFELYSVLQGKLFNIDDVLNQIINTAA